MKAFKTLLLIRMRFFWPGMRKIIMTWVKSCAGCIPADIRNRESSGLNHSWPITVPFAILSVDIWKPGVVKNADGFIALLNAMCDMTQFVVMTPVKKLECTYVARAFMESVLLRFGLCVLVVIDEGREFCGLFRSMCAKLNIRCHVVAKRNHKAVGVERFHRFLNHSQRICSEERGTPATFVECGLTTAYAWNASPIDGTDILRSVPAIGRELKFPLDIHESDLPAPTSDVTASVVDYIRYLGRDISYARDLIGWLLRDRRTAHRERTNEKRSPIVYKVGDIVMGRVSVQSSIEKGVSQKMVYQSRGPFVIERVTGYDTYYVRRYGKPQSPLQKFMSCDLYLLPPQILPCQHVDTPTLRYLNSDFAPLKHPFGRNFDIESYNTSWFEDKPVSRPPDFLLDSTFFDNSAKNVKPLSESIPNNQLIKLSDISPEGVEKLIQQDIDTTQLSDIDTAIVPMPPSTGPTQIKEKHVEKISFEIDKSNDKLCFVTFTPANTLRPRWFLVQVIPLDLNETPLPPGVFFCTFLQKHPKDHNKADNESRWWPEWRELLWENKDDYEFGDRILFTPSQKPDETLFGKFGSEIDFNIEGTLLVGPFNFLPRSITHPGNSFIDETFWKELSSACEKHYLTPPTISHGLKITAAKASCYRLLLHDNDYCDTLSNYSSLETMRYLFKNQGGTPGLLRNARKSDG